MSEEPIGHSRLPDRHLRPLLPASREVAARAAEAREDRPSSEAHKRVGVACESCRRRKVKCDGTRPRCTYCSSRSLSCEYASDVQGESHNQALRRKLDELRQSYTVYKQIYQQLQSRPLAEAEEIFRRIRGGEEPESILEYVEGGDLLLQLLFRSGTSR